jgi:hypothetical protein
VGEDWVTELRNLVQRMALYKVAGFPWYPELRAVAASRTVAGDQWRGRRGSNPQPLPTDLCLLDLSCPFGVTWIVGREAVADVDISQVFANVNRT